MNTKDWLDKIEWDKNENPSDYSFSYINFGEERKISYESIITRDDFAFCLNQDGKLKTIPYHRIRKIFKNDKIVFSRKG